jgi:multidrug resistance efflux pump
MPALVAIDGTGYPVHEWGTDGFDLDGNAPQGRLHDNYEVTLQLSFDAFRLTFDLTARVSRIVDDKAREFEFVDLEPGHAATMEQIIDRWLAGEPTPFGRVSAIPAGAEPLRSTPRSGRATEGFSRLSRLTAGLAISLLVLGGIGTVVVTRILTVTSHYAAIAADLTQVRAEQDGVLSDSQFAAGKRVKKGALLGYMRPAVSSQEREAVLAQAAVVTAHLNEERSALSTADAGFHNFKSVAETAYKSASAERIALDHEVGTQMSIVGRYRGLARDGYVAAVQADQQEQSLHDLQRQRAIAAANEEAARQSLANAGQGLYGGDGHLTQRTPSEIQATVAELEAQERQLTQQLSVMDTNLPITSPCDCTVMAAHAATGQFVAKNGAIFDLGNQNDRQIGIDALVPASSIKTLRVGQEARVYLADRKAPIVGHIASVNLNAANTGRIGLPDALRSLDLYALVTVSIDATKAPDLNEPAGTPATVDFPLQISALARSLVGLSGP